METNNTENQEIDLTNLTYEELKAKAEEVESKVKEIKAKEDTLEEEKKANMLKRIQKAEKKLEDVKNTDKVGVVETEQKNTQPEGVSKEEPKNKEVETVYLGDDEFTIEKNKSFLISKNWNYDSKEYKILNDYLKMGKITDFESGLKHAGVQYELSEIAKENEAFSFIKDGGVDFIQDKVEELRDHYKKTGQLPADKELAKKVLEG